MREQIILRGPSVRNPKNTRELFTPKFYISCFYFSVEWKLKLGFTRLAVASV